MKKIIVYWEKDRPKPAVSRREFLDRLLLK